MLVRVRAKDSFAHDGLDLHVGQFVMMDESLARDLAHLVDIEPKEKPPHANKMIGPAENKGNISAAGEAQPSSASPAAPASPETTAKLSASGGKRGRIGE